MTTVVETDIFVDWLAKLRDTTGHRAIIGRIARLTATSNLGDRSSVGDNVHEMRIHAGPGYRLYYTIRGSEVVLLLCGGDKGSQERDIARAKKMAAGL
jgi:putative addiction module killer protein